MQKRIQRHIQSQHEYEAGSEAADLLRRLINPRKDKRHAGQACGNRNAQRRRAENDLISTVFRFFHLPRPQKLADDDRHAVSDRQKYDIEHIV